MFISTYTQIGSVLTKFKSGQIAVVVKQGIAECGTRTLTHRQIRLGIEGFPEVDTCF